MNQFESEATRAAAEAQEGGIRLPREVTLSNGIVLNVKPMPPLLLNAVANSVPEPEIPQVHIADDDRWEENPNDPAYQKALAETTAKRELATINLILAVCTSVGTLPDDRVGPDSDDWLYIPDMAGIAVDATNPRARYIAWLRFYALETQQDLMQANSLPILLAGISEGEVAEVINSFRRREERPVVAGLPAEVASANGNHVSPSSNRAGRRARGT